jgi:HK97 family phage prohead protease
MNKLIKSEKNLARTLNFSVKSVDEKNYIVEGEFSHQIEDRQGDIVIQSGWDLTNYLKNPVVLWAHDHYSPPIAKMIEIGVNAQNILAGKMQFAVNEYPFAATIYALIKGGFQKAFSVGFNNNQYEASPGSDVALLTSNELYEVSAVPVGADQLALAKTKGIDVKELEKGAIAYADHGNADEGTAWDGPAQIADCGDDMGKLKAICAWFDSGNADVKASYKLPHHQADGLKAVWKGVAAAMGALLGGRGGVDIPEADRKGVYNHLAKHYKDFEKEVPEFKEYSEEEIKMISEGGCPEPAVKAEKAVEAISKSNVETIRAAIRTLTGVLNDVAEADNQVAEKGRLPLNKGGNKKIPVSLINRAIRELWAIKRAQK